MVFTVKYRKAGPRLTSYDWIDEATGTGYFNFYAGAVSVTTNGETWGEDYILSNKPFYSHILYTQSASTALTAYTKMMTLDFDVVLNKPITLRGQAIVEVPYSTSGFGYVKIIIKKNGVEIASDSASAYENATYVTSTTRIIIPETSFVSGDTLRLTAEAWCKKNNGNNGSLTLAHDPYARSADYQPTPGTWNAAYSSRLLFMCPIKVID